MGDRKKVLVVDRAGDWRDQVVAALKDSDLEVEATEDGADGVGALCAGEPNAIFIGECPGQPTGIDILREAAQRSGQSGKDVSFSLPVFFVTDVRDDDYLELVRSRGGKHIVHRDADLASAAHDVLEAIFGASRSHQRIRANLDARIALGAEEFSGQLVDISASGAFFTIAHNKAPEVSSGDTVEIRIENALGDELVCSAIIRNIRPVRSLFRKRVGYGLQFTDLDRATEARIEQVINSITEDKLTQNLQLPYGY